MSELRVMDGSGDTKIIWSEDNQDEVDAAEVTKWKEFIQLTTDLHSKLAPEWQQDFITHLTESKARTKAAVQSAYNATVKAQLEDARRKEEELARQQSKVEAERIRLQQEQERNEQVQAILDCVIHGDFTEVAKTLEPNSIDIIITDPPYPQEYLPLYEQLATVAAQLLKPGGSLLAMCGQSYLPQVLNLMTPHLNYHWALSYLTPGGQSPQIWPRKINSFWKPVLWFVKGEYSDDWHGDVIKSAVNDNDKRFHEWGQSESGMAQKMLEAEWRGTVFYVGQPYCLGAVKHWFQRELFQQETWVIPASITGAINGTFEALMRNPFLLQKVQAASIDSVYRARARGLQIEFTVKEWFKKNWPKLYLPPENEGKFSQPCNHDFRLRINGKSIDVDISGPNKNGKHGNSAGKNPADYHLLCDIAHDGQNVEWLGVVNKSHYQPDLSLEITGSPVKMIVWLNCIQAGLNYDVLRKAAYGIKSNAN